MILRKSIAAAVLAIGITAASPAVAEPILLDKGSIGQSFTIDYNGFVDGDNVIDGLGAQTTFTLTGIRDNRYTFDYSITNTTDIGAGIGSRISSFAFNTDPDIRGVSSTGTYAYSSTNSNYPNGIGRVDACFRTTRNGNCTGNGGGLEAGESGSGTLTLNFLKHPKSLTLSDFFVRYQSVSGVPGISSASGAQVSSGGSSGGSSSGGTDVPEPGMLLLFGMAVVGLAYFRRRRPEAGNGQLAPSYA